MTFRGALVSRGMYMGVSIDQMTNDGYFPTQKEHFHLLEGVSKNIWANTFPYSVVTPGTDVVSSSDPWRARMHNSLTS